MCFHRKKTERERETPNEKVFTHNNNHYKTNSISKQKRKLADFRYSTHCCSSALCLSFISYFGVRFIHPEIQSDARRTLTAAQTITKHIRLVQHLVQLGSRRQTYARCPWRQFVILLPTTVDTHKHTTRQKLDASGRTTPKRLETEHSSGGFEMEI